MLQAMNTGHDGSLTTVHANSARDALHRLETLMLLSGVHLPSQAMREQISSALDVVIHVTRMSDGTRRVVSVNEIVGMERDVVAMQDIFLFKKTGISQGGKVEGRYEASWYPAQVCRSPQSQWRKCTESVLSRRAGDLAWISTCSCQALLSR